MSAAKHTPGPWVITRYEGGGKFPPEPSDHFVAIDGEGWGALTRVPVKVDGEPSAEGEANARLMSAAPDMLAVLQSLMPNTLIGESYEPPVPSDEVLKEFLFTWGKLRAARAAIAKALGHGDGQ